MVRQGSIHLLYGGVFVCDAKRGIVRVNDERQENGKLEDDRTWEGREERRKEKYDD